MKACIKCHSRQPITEFYAHPKMKDGHLNKCKSCVKAAARARRDRLASDPEWMEAERVRHRKKAARMRREGRVAPPSKEARRAATQRHRAKHPLAARARNTVARAIAAGAITRQPCAHGKCRRRAQAHHDDYSKPLDVIWLCPSHHAARHVELRKMKRIAKL